MLLIMVLMQCWDPILTFLSRTTRPHHANYSVPNHSILVEVEPFHSLVLTLHFVGTHSKTCLSVLRGSILCLVSNISFCWNPFHSKPLHSVPNNSVMFKNHFTFNSKYPFYRPFHVVPPCWKYLISELWTFCLGFLFILDELLWSTLNLVATDFCKVNLKPHYTVMIAY